MPSVFFELLVREAEKRGQIFASYVMSLLLELEPKKVMKSVEEETKRGRQKKVPVC